LGFLNQRKQAKMQWLRCPNQSNVDNLNNVKCETSRHFRNKKKDMKPKIDDLEIKVRSKISGTCIGASVTLRRVTSLGNILQDERSVLVTGFHSILARWRNHFFQLLNVLGANGVRQT
jgi:hypothetical protein